MPPLPLADATATLDYSWSFEPWAIVVISLIGLVYVRRWRAARAQTGPRAASGWRLLSFMGALAALVAALISPIDSLGDDLLVMHMTQHLLLLDVAPVLGLLGLTKVILRPATRRLQPVERAAGVLGHPIFAMVFYVGVMWLWHAPPMYDLALDHEKVHILEHVCFGVAGGLYWWHLLSPVRSRMRLGGMGPVAYMLGTKLLVGILGIVIAFAPGSLYGHYAHDPSFWGMSPHTDQAVAGLLMALEQSVVMGAALVWLFARMLDESEREERRTERYA